MSHELFRKLVKWFGIVILVHLVAMLFFGMVFSSTAAALQDEGDVAIANRMTFFFDIAVNLIFVIIYMKLSASFSDYNKAIRDAMKDPSFSVIGYYKTAFLKYDLMKIAIFAVFQIPFVIFYAVAGYSFLHSTLMDRLYLLDAGYYALTGSSILGFLFSVAVFAVAFVLVRLLMIKSTKKNNDI